MIAFVLRYWPYIAGAALLIGAYLWIDHRGYQRAETKALVQIGRIEKAATAKLNEIRTKAIEARSKQIANARRVETQQNEVSHETERDLLGRIASLRAALSVRGATAAHPDSVGKAGLPFTPSAAGSAAGDGGTAQLHAADELICGVNTIKAQGWQEWWERVSAIEREAR